MSLYVVKTFKERLPLLIDVTIKLNDGRAMTVPAYMARLNKKYAQYELDVGGMDEREI